MGGDGSGSGCGRWWLVAVVVGFVFAVVFLWWVSNGGCWLEFVIGDFVWSRLRKKIKDLGRWFFFSCCGSVVVVVDVCAVLIFFFWMFLLLF